MKSLYFVYDTLAEIVVGQVMTVTNDAVARREFHAALADARTSLSQHPQDYELRCLGVMNDQGDFQSSPYTVDSGKTWLAYQAAQKQQEG